MSNDDIFAPPSQEELNNSMFAAPTADELSSSKSPEAKAPESTANTLVTKLAEGGSLGLDDELAGLISGAGRVAGVSGLGGKIKDIGLAKDGPTLDMEKLLQAYRDTRDKTRSMKDQMSEESPILSPAMNLVGGLMTGKAIPGKLMAPLGSAAADAALATKVAIGSANAVPLGAVAGVANSKADLTKGDFAGALEDAKGGAEMGGLIGGAIPLVGAGLKSATSGATDKVKALLAKIMPQPIKTAYANGQNNIDTTGPEFYENTLNNQNAVADEVADPIMGKVANQKNAQGKTIQDLEGKISTSENLNAQKLAESQAKAQAQQAEKTANIERQMVDIQDESQRAVDLGKAKASAQNADEIVNLNKKTVQVAENLQKRVQDVKQALGKQFDEIEEAASKTGVVPDTKGVLEAVQNNLVSKSALTEPQISSIMNKLGSATDAGGYQGFKNLKGQMANLFDHSDPTVRSAMKQGYSALKNGYADSLKAKGFDALADRMKETNGRWGAAMELEDKFLSNLQPSRFTGEMQASPDTIRAVGQFTEKNPVQMAQADYMSGLLNKFDPEGAKQSIQSMSNVADDLAAAKIAKPDVPMLPNPKLAKLEELLAQAKMQKPEVPELPNAGTTQLQQQLGQVKEQNPAQIAGLDLNTSDPVALKNQLLSLLPKAGMETADPKAENQLNQIFDFLKQNKGEDYVNQLKAKLSPLNQDIALNKLGKSNDELPTNVKSLISKVLGGTTNIANKLGRMNQTKNQNFLKVGSDKLVNASPEQLNELAGKMSTMGNVGAQYSEVLKSSVGKNDISRNAIMNSLMQQPAFRALFHNANGTHEGSGDESK